MEIAYGQDGVAAAVLNCETGVVYPLNGRTAPEVAIATPPTIDGPTAQMFAFLGGQQHTKEGYKGVGTLPDNANLAQCGVLRTDMKRPKLPLHTLVGPEAVRCVVTAYGHRIDPLSMVIFVRQSEQHGTEVCFAKNRPTAVLKALNVGTARSGPQREILLRSYGTFGSNGEISAKSITVKLYGSVPSKVGNIALRRLLELVFWDDLFRPGHFEQSSITAWQGGLGLARAIDSQLYFNVCGILRQKFLPPSDWQKAFHWVTFVSDPRHGFADGSLYMSAGKGVRRLVASYPLRMAANDKPLYFVTISDAAADAIARTGELTPALLTELLPPTTEKD